MPEYDTRALSERIRELADNQSYPDGVAYLSLALADAAALAREHAAPPLEVEALALEIEIIPERYARNFRGITAREQLALLRSRAVVVGLGGLGGLAAEGLTRMGVGRVTVADGDSFEQSNMNRQLLCDASWLDRRKAVAARKRLAAVNPHVEIEVIDRFLERKDFAALFTRADIVLDCLGGLDQREMIATEAARAGKPLITAAMGGMVGVAGAVFPGATPPVSLMRSSGGLETSLGSPFPCAAMAASLQCSEAMLTLLGKRARDNARMIYFDLAQLHFEAVALPDGPGGLDRDSGLDRA